MFSDNFEAWADGIFVAVLIVCGIAWALLLRHRVRSRLPLLEPEPRIAPFWTLAEFFVCFGMFIICIAASQRVGRGWMSPETVERLEAGTFEPSMQTSQDMLVLIVSSTVASMLAMLSVMVWMNLTSVRELKRFGLWLSLNDLKLGSKAAFLVLPPVLLLSTVINSWVTYKHSVIDTLGANPTLAVLFGIAFSTVLLTPIFEEFTFRVLLQGGAEQLSRRVQATGTLQRQSEAPEWEVIPASEVATWSWWPVVMASGTFAALHIGQGAAPVPLFFLSLALGYIYRQTGRIGPCIVVHAILNAFTVSLTMLKLWLDQTP